MDAFNYLAVLISIILGLGIAQLLSGLGRCIEHRVELKNYAPAMIWAGILLLIHVQTWWSMFGFRLLPQWTFVSFAVVLLQPITLYLLTILVLPSQSSAAIDLRVNYFSQRQWFFGLLSFLLIVSVLKDLVVSGSFPAGLNLGFHIFFILASVLALSTERDWVHLGVAILSALVMVAYVGLLFGQLQ